MFFQKHGMSFTKLIIFYVKNKCRNEGERKREREKSICLSKKAIYLGKKIFTKHSLSLYFFLDVEKIATILLLVKQNIKEEEEEEEEDIQRRKTVWSIR